MVEKGLRATAENRGADAVAAYRGQRRAARGDGRGAQARHVLEIEDVLLAGWVLASEALVRRWFGEPSELTHTVLLQAGGDGWIDWLRALPPTGWAILALFLFILLTRGPEDTDRDVALGRRWPMLTFALPLLSIYSLIATGIRNAIVGRPELPPGAQPPWPGPYVPSIVRRTAAIPLALLGDALFRQEMAFAGLDVTTAGWQPELSPTLLLTVVASALPFAIFVAGPRIAAGDVLAWRPWILRFSVFYASVFASLVW